MRCNFTPALARGYLSLGSSPSRRLPAGATEEANMVLAATLIARSALRRQESRGGHYRSDYPSTRLAWSRKHVRLRLGEEPSER
jgi:L-aspartate oxidase